VPGNKVVLTFWFSFRDVGVAVLQSHLGHSQIQFSQLGQLVEGCQQQPCLVRIAGRALAEGCVAPQAIVSQASGKLSNLFMVIT
jgi:hypothetical protein